MHPVTVRLASSTDAQALAPVVQRYVEETFRFAWGGTETGLRAALESGDVRVLLLERAGALVGFAAMVDDYDLHHCVRGLRVIDMYVAAAHRGRCLGAVLLAQVAQHALGKCLGYVRGEAVPTATTRRLFERTLLRFGDTYNLSGKALRRLAELRDAPLRELVRGLPTREMNVEP